MIFSGATGAVPAGVIRELKAIVVQGHTDKLMVLNVLDIVANFFKSRHTEIVTGR